MKKFITFVFLLTGFCAFAQESIDTVFINNTGKVTIELDPEISNFLTNKEKTSCAITTPKNNNTPNPTKPKNNSSDPCAGKTQMLGYKVQVYYSKDRAQADKVKAEFSKNFPSISAETAYMAPDYRVLVGDYFSKSSANSDIRKIKSKYNSAFAIQYRILCRKAK